MPLTRSVRSRRYLVLAVVAAALGVLPASATAASPVTVTAQPIAKPLGAKAAVTRVAVTNTTRKRIGGLKLSVGRAAGVRVTVAGARKGRASRSLPALAGGKTTRVTVRLRRVRGGPASGSLTVRVTRGKRTLASAPLAFGPSATTPPANPNTLAGRYFWGTRYTVSGVDARTLYFTGDDLVFTKDMESAVATCAAADEQCRPYRYDAASGQLVIDGEPATLSGRTLELGGIKHRELGFPPAGARWDITLTHASSRGVCPLLCTYYREDLTFRPDGTFVRNAIASGTGPVVDWSSIPPDRKGTYEVRADRTLRLAFEDGSERVETVGLFLDETGRTEPPAEAGMVLAGDGYFDLSD